MRIMLVTLVSLLPSLAQQPLPPAPPSAPFAPGFVNHRLGLPAYPGSRIFKYEAKHYGSSEVEFEAGASFEQVYAHFHDHLSRAGWSRWGLQPKGAAIKLEAFYQRGNTSFKLELEQKWGGGWYKPEGGWYKPEGGWYKPGGGWYKLEIEFYYPWS